MSEFDPQYLTVAPSHGRQRIWAALLFAAVCHAVFIYHWQLELPARLIPSPTLKVELRRIPVDTPHVPEQPVPTPRTHEESAVLQQSADIPEDPETLDKTLDKTPDKTPDKTWPPEEPAMRSGMDLYLRALESARTQPAPEPGPHFRTFSIDDLPAHDSPGDPYAPRMWLKRQYAAHPEVSSRINPEGNLTVRRVDEFGNVSCIVRRDYGGDQPPMWFFAQASECP